MTEIQRFISRIRTHYLTALAKEINIYNQTFHKTNIEELITLDGPQHLPPIFHQRRVDMVSNSRNHTDFTEFKQDNHIYFRPTKLSLNSNMKISLEPFMWNDADFECSAFNPNAPLLQHWAHHWIEREQPHPHQNDFGLIGCVHGLSFPINDEDCCRFSVDFGSADTQAFIELIEILYRVGVERVRIYSRSLYQ